jgi:hypothetical protein
LTQAVAKAGRAANALRWAILGGLTLMLGANLPGHLSYDSVVQLFEGRTGLRVSHAPGIMSWILGRFDGLLPGTGLYVTAVAALLYGALASLTDLRPRTSWAAVLVALAVILTPSMLIYQGIVWKDVLFANLAVAGFVCLAHAARRWTSGQERLPPLAGALVLLSLAALARQNGVIVVMVAALALAWTARTGGWRNSVAWGLGGLVASLLLTQSIGLMVQPRGSSMTYDTAAGVRVIQLYDILGAVAEDPKLKLDVFEQADPALVALVRTEGVKAYSPERIDRMVQSPAVRAAAAHVPQDVIARQWWSIVTESPRIYLDQRSQVFRWLIAPPVPDRCLLLHVGVAGPADKLGLLGLTPGVRPQDQALLTYAARYFGTPFYSHLAYGVVALALAAALVLRGEPADIVMAALMAAALAFAASFFVISLACDYRYLYFVDAAALTGLIYLFLDPPFPRRRPRAAAPAP